MFSEQQAEEGVYKRGREFCGLEHAQPLLPETRTIRWTAGADSGGGALHLTSPTTSQRVVSICSLADVGFSDRSRYIFLIGTKNKTMVSEIYLVSKKSLDS
ncbi:hypothetical protein J6590_057803 [Homalodisca vitripennis]|nr:hypothetical protein J6590_057803 [Homalodisca vitripennis]